MPVARRVILGVVMAVASLTAPAAPVPPSSEDGGFQVIRRETTLPIAAVSRHTLSRALSDLHRAQGWHGRTSMAFEQTAELVPDDAGCRMDRLRTTLEVTVTLPRLDPGNAREPRDVERLWRASLSLLRAHEEGHVAIGVAGAKASHDRLNALGRFASCREARRALIREELRLRHHQAMQHARYDRRTDFGRRQGPLRPSP